MKKKKTFKQAHIELLDQLLSQMDKWYARSVKYKEYAEQAPEDYYWELSAHAYLTCIYELTDLICEIEERDLASIKKFTKKYMDIAPWDE